MTFSTSSNTYLLVAVIMTQALFTALTILIALGLGLLFRRLLIRRLQKTVLDKWIVQTLGVVIVFPPLILAAIAVSLIWNPELFMTYWDSIKSQVKITDLIALVWRCVETLLLIGLGMGLARTARTLTIRALGENRIDINIRTLIGRIFYFIILIFAISWILSIWEISVGIPVTVIGILTVAITVAIQDVLKDLVAGFYILIERPFRIGDQISTSTPAAYTGRVEDIQLRATKLRLVSGEELIIPNSLIFGNIVVNNTYYSERRATITITVPEEEFVKGETPEQLLKAISAIEGVLVKPEPTVKLTGYTEKNALLSARFWIANGQLSSVSDVMYTLHTALPSAELTVREPGGDV